MAAAVDTSKLLADQNVRLPASAAQAQSFLMLAAGVAGAGALLLGVIKGDGLAYFFHSYLTAFIFIASITLGALFFVVLQHLVGAEWSVAVRRVAELLALNMIPLAILFIPIAALIFANAGTPNTTLDLKHRLYTWTDIEAMKAAPILTGKTTYLNPTFFCIRSAIYFAIWIFLARFMYLNSRRQDDDKSLDHTAKVESVAPPAMLAFALTLTFAAFDWVMSLNPTWYSTIFGIYFFAGAAVSIFATLIVATMLLQRAGALQGCVNVEHFHDLGKFMWGFMVFWSYIAFSQFMLIWYGNIPEETQFYMLRKTGPWEISYLLIFVHFAIPVLGFIGRQMKRNRTITRFGRSGSWPIGSTTTGW